MANEVTNKDLYDLIQGLIKKTDGIQKQNSEIKNQLALEIRTVKSDIAEEISQIRQENAKLREENEILKEQLIGIGKKVKKYNLIFYGVEEKENRTNEIQTFLHLININLQVECKYADIRDIFRLGKVNQERPRPLSVEFVNYTLKLDVLKQSKLLKGTGIFIAQDYTTEEYEQRKILYQHLNVARDHNKHAIIKQNNLYVNGQKFSYKDLKGKPNNFTLKEAEEEDDEASNEKGDTEVTRNNEEITEQEYESNSNPTELFFKQTGTIRRQDTNKNGNPSRRPTRANRERGTETGEY